jgi:hypothetical protein
LLSWSLLLRIFDSGSPNLREVQFPITLGQDPEHWIPLPPDEWQQFMRYYSGNRPEGRKVLIEALKNHHSHAAALPLMDIQRGPPHAGRRGGIVTVTCGSCPYSGTFQKVAEHIVSEHLNLSLWYCDTDSWWVIFLSCHRQTLLISNLPEALFLALDNMTSLVIARCMEL